MSTNNHDNPMTRFLFAILSQKNLKDIDWNKVAHDPVLNQEITNGHAARMRYSRFRSAMLGLEPTRRNRTGTPKSRVTKAKKGLRGKKTEGIKSEPTSESPMPQGSSVSPPPPSIVKQESSPYSFESRLSPRLTPGPGQIPVAPTMANTPTVIQPRLLTPSSDMDMFSPSPGLTPSPTTGELLNPSNSFDFRSSPCPDTEAAWAHAPPYTTFAAAAYTYDDYGSYDHPHMHHHAQLPLGMSHHSIESDADYVNVKREDWDQYS